MTNSKRMVPCGCGRLFTPNRVDLCETCSTIRCKVCHKEFKITERGMDTCADCRKAKKDKARKNQGSIDG